MKTLGLLGGMSWESTLEYYRIINEEIKRELGGLHSAKILLHSVDFAEIEEYQAAGQWAESAKLLAAAARSLVGAGADCIVICTNTMHKVAPQIQAAAGVPLLHIAEAARDAVIGQGLQKVGLLGTRYTMTQPFYRTILEEAGIEVLIPDEADVELVNRVIYEELCCGVVSPASKKEYLRVIEALGARGAQGVILGCTEIGLLIGPDDTALPVFDTAVIHAKAAASYAVQR